MNEFSIEAFREGPERDLLLTLMDVSRDYRSDPDFRARIEADPRGELAARDVNVEPPEAEVRLAVNTPEVFHLVMGANPNAAVSDMQLAGVAGGSSASTAATTSSASTASTAPSCFGSAGTASTLGSAGSAGAPS